MGPLGAKTDYLIQGTQTMRKCENVKTEEADEWKWGMIIIMGLVAAVKRSCIQAQDEDADIVIDERSKEINDDYAYFQQECWYRLQSALLFDPNKFIFLNTNYKQSQLKLISQWKVVDTRKLKSNEKLAFNDRPLHLKWKYAIRKGVPIIHYKNMIELLFAKNFALDDCPKRYQSLLYEELRKNNGKVEIITFREESFVAFSTPFLNKQGTEAAKRIAFLISRTHSQLERNPYILSIISLLLIFVSEADAYDIVGTMIEGSTSISVQRQESLRWHFSLDDNHFDKFAREFFKTVKQVSPSISIINDHLNSEGIDKFEIFKQIIADFFIGYLPFPVVLRIFMVFLNEGVRALYRFFYAIVKVSAQGIKDSTSTKQIIRVIRTKMLINLCDEDHVRLFFRLAYDLRLRHTCSLSKIENDCSQGKEEPIAYYLPEVQGASQILSFVDMEVIWGYLPDVIKHYDARKVFSTAENTPTLNRMLGVLCEQQMSLIIVETFEEEVFGVFIAEKFKTNTQLQMVGVASKKSQHSLDLLDTSTLSQAQKAPRKPSSRDEPTRELVYFGTSQNFVFTLSPVKKKHSTKGQNIFYCAYTDSQLVIGGPPSTPALQVDSTLTQGLSYACPTFNNPPLHSGAGAEFKIKMIECFTVQ